MAASRFVLECSLFWHFHGMSWHSWSVVIICTFCGDRVETVRAFAARNLFRGSQTTHDCAAGSYALHARRIRGGINFCLPKNAIDGHDTIWIQWYHDYIWEGRSWYPLVCWFQDTQVLQKPPVLHLFLSTQCGQTSLYCSTSCSNSRTIRLQMSGAWLWWSWWIHATGSWLPIPGAAGPLLWWMGCFLPGLHTMWCTCRQTRGL